MWLKAALLLVFGVLAGPAWAGQTLLPTCNNGVIVTGPTGIPSCSTVLPTGVSTGGELLGTPAANTLTQGLYVTQTAAGTVAGLSSNCQFDGAWGYVANCIQMNDAVSATSQYGSSAFSIVETINSTAVGGAKNGLVVGQRITATPSYLGYGVGTNAPAYVAAFFSTAANANQNGTAPDYTHAAGSIFGINPNVALDSGATNFYELTGAEFDIGAFTGSTLARKDAIHIVSSTGDAVHGSVDEAAIALGDANSNSNTTGWLRGISFGFTSDYFPVASSGTLITANAGATGGTPSVVGGVDFSALAFTGCAFKTSILCLGDSNNYIAANGNNNMGFAQETGGLLAEFDGVGGNVTDANHVAFVAGATGNQVGIDVVGTDSNIDIGVNPKGTGNFVVSTGVKAGTIGSNLTGASPYGSLAGAFYRALSVSDQDLYGFGCTAAAFSVYATSGAATPGQVICQVNGGDSTGPWGPAEYPGGEDRDATIFQIDGAPNTFGGLLAGTFTSTTFAPTTPLTPTLVAKLRIGMRIKTNDATPYWGLLTAWAANGTSVSVSEWCLQNAGVGSCTSGTPSGDHATISPKNGIWAQNDITTRSSTSEERQAIGNEFDVNNNTGTDDTGIDATTWPFDIGVVIQGIGTNKATSGLVVSGTFISGITIESSGTYGLLVTGGPPITITSSGDTHVDIKSTGTGTPSWALQTVVGSGTAGRFRLYDTLNGVETFTVLKNGAGATLAGMLTVTGAIELTGSPPTPTGSCSIDTQVGGNAAGSFLAAGACASGTVILTFATAAPNGYVCNAQDLTTSTDSLKQTAYGTQSCTLTGSMVDDDKVVFHATAF